MDRETMKLQAITGSKSVRQARALLRRRDSETLAEQIRIAEIPAPTGSEGARGDYVATRFAELGLLEPYVDEVGNVSGSLPGGASGSATDGAPVLIAAHLDTIFPGDTAIVPRTEGNRVYAPGITDNARGIAATIALAETFQTIGIRPDHTIVFVATVGEEGLGDLRGVKHLFRPGSPHRSATAFISLDGAGTTRIVHRAVGARRLRVTITGRGGHSWGDRGAPNPIHAIGDAIGRIGALSPPGDDQCAVNVGRVGGGTSINAIPSEAWCEIDLRSELAASLDWLERETRMIVEEEVRCAAGRPDDQALACRIDLVGSRPCGATPTESELVQAALHATRIVGKVPALAASSTDANVPISLGVPAITLGAGGRGGGIHTLDEWFDSRDGPRGIERALLTVLAIAGIHEPGQARDEPESTTESSPRST